MFRSLFFFLFVVALAASCSSENSSSQRPVNEAGTSYVSHLLVNDAGDTIPTGVPIPSKGKQIHPDSISEPRTPRVSGEPKVMPVHTNIRRAPNPRFVALPDEMKTITPGKNGVPLPKTAPARPKIVPAIHPAPIPATEPTFIEKANIDIQRIGLEQGLKYVNVRSVFEDSRGYMWLGITDHGVSRYDGNSFTHYSRNEGLVDNNVYCMLEDSRGNLWFATRGGGVCRYDGVNFYHFTRQEGLSDDVVWCMLEDKRGHIWFGTQRGGAVRYDPEAYDGQGGFTYYTTEQGLNDIEVFSMLEDSHGHLWFGSWRGGVTRFDGESITHFTMREGLTSNSILCMAEDDQGQLWFGTPQGINRFDGAGFAHFTTDEGLRYNEVWSMVKDKRGDLWFIQNPGILCRYNGTTFTDFTEEQGITGPFLSLMEDSRGNIWLGSLATGVYRFNPTGFTYYAEQDGLLGNAIRSKLKDSRGNLWFGAWPGGLTQYVPDSEIRGAGRFVQPPQIRVGASGIGGMCEDSHGRLWFGWVSGGVGYLDLLSLPSQGTNAIEPAEWQVDVKHYTKKEGLSGYNNRRLLEDSRGNLWFATWNDGLTRYHLASGQFTHFTTNDGLLGNGPITQLFEDRSGNLWFVTRDQALSRFDGDAFTHYTTKEGLPSDRISGLLEDSRGRFWVGTMDEGVTCYQISDQPESSIGIRLAQYKTEDGLSDNQINGMIEDDRKNIWITTRQGITVLTPVTDDPDSAATNHFRVLTMDRTTGRKRIGLSKGLIDRDNFMWWGSQDGLLRLDLNQFEPDWTPPSIHLSTVEVEQTFIDYRRLADTAYRHSLAIGKDLAGAFDSVPSFYNYPLNLKLPHDLNHLTFQFSGLDWAAPGMIRYSYFLEGFDKHWSLSAPENKADYRNLPPGRYTFKVKAKSAASGLDGWSDPFEYRFAIHPPWWLAWPAWVLYGFFTLFLLYHFYRFLLARQLEHVEVRRLQELDAFKTRLYTNITHEFRTPLTVILGMVRQIREDPKKWYGDGLEMIYRNGQQLLRLVNQMLDLSRLDQGKLQLRMQQGEIVSFLHYLVQSFESYAATKDIQLHFLKEMDRLAMDYDPDQLTKVVSNLLSNAVKYTPAGGQVYVIVESRSTSEGAPSGAYLQIRVKDTGPGIPPEELSHIFNRFYQVDDSATRRGEGSGLGLALARELVQLMGGEIRVQSRLGEGTDFTLLLPVSRSAPQLPVSTEVEQRIRPFEVNAGDGLQARFDEKGITPAETDLPIVLLIEDNRDVLTYLASCLESSYHLEFAVNGREGIEQALELVPDLIISDVMMPEKDGYEVCATLKEDIRTSHIPIILLTAKADRDARLEGLKAGADAYLAKPFDREELEVLMEKMLALRRQLQQRYGNLQSAPESTEQPATKEALFLADLRTIIEDNLSDESFGIAQLCRAIGMSRSQLHNKVKALTGLSTSHYIRAIRLERAKELLLRTDLNISEIAYEVGFRTPLYFTQAFTEAVGMAPSVFRQR